MNAFAARHVSVWLDEIAPEQGAFRHGLEWASRLHLPLRIVGPTPETGGGATPGERLRNCAILCSRSHVSFETAADQALMSGGSHPPDADDLCVFSQALPPHLRGELFRRARQGAGTSVLISTPSWQPVSRVLVVHRGCGEAPFLAAAAELCRRFAAHPVVLTVARSEAEAAALEPAAREAFAAGLPFADFDRVVGWDASEAVRRVARWRRCSHVFLARPEAGPWWQRLRGDLVRPLLGLSDSLTILALRPFPDESEDCLLRPDFVQSVGESH